MSALSRHAETRHWKRELAAICAQALGATRNIRNTDGSEAVPGRLRCYWAVGLLQVTPEHGMELNAAGLCLLGRGAEVRHRLWRGQAAMLLPMLDDTRLKMCAQLTCDYRREWP